MTRGEPQLVEYRDRSEQPVLMMHDVYEADRPDEADSARSYENARRAHHVRAHGSDEGYVPGREFPCPGALRVYAETVVGHALVACDVCRFEVSFKVTRPAESAATGGIAW